MPGPGYQHRASDKGIDSQAEIRSRYAATIGALIADVLAPDLRTLSAMAKAGHRIAERRAGTGCLNDIH